MPEAESSSGVSLKVFPSTLPKHIMDNFFLPQSPLTHWGFMALRHNLFKVALKQHECHITVNIKAYCWIFTNTAWTFKWHAVCVWINNHFSCFVFVKQLWWFYLIIRTVSKLAFQWGHTSGLFASNPHHHQIYNPVSIPQRIMSFTKALCSSLCTE